MSTSKQAAVAPCKNE